MLLKATASSSISSLEESSTFTRASRLPWPKALADRAMSRRGLLSRRANTVTASTEISTTNTAVVRKMLEIRLRIFAVVRVGVDTMTMPLTKAPESELMGTLTTYRRSE